MPLKKKVTRLLPVVESEISRGRYPFAPQLILSLMSYESGGNIGDVNEKTGASGLIQVMPGTLKWYNDQNDPISLYTMRSTSSDAASPQLRVGLWVLGKFWRSAYRWIRKTTETVPLGDLVRYGDSFYAAGPGRVQGMAGNIPRTWNAWKSRYPKSNITKHAEIVWSRTAEQNPTWDMPAIDSWIRSDEIEKPPKPDDSNKKKIGLLVGLVVVLVASWLMRRKDNDGQ